MNAYVKAWQCIGCVKIEAPQTSIDVCREYKFEQTRCLLEAFDPRPQFDLPGPGAARLAENI